MQAFLHSESFSIVTVSVFINKQVTKQSTTAQYECPQNFSLPKKDGSYMNADGV